jgi:hypothetical protein
VRAFLENGTIANAVNFPNVDMVRESPYRVAIANANVPNMLGQISLAMGHGGLNIHNMVNKSRGEMAYTLVDVDSPVPERGRRGDRRDRRRAVGARDTERGLARDPGPVAPTGGYTAGGARCARHGVASFRAARRQSRAATPASTSGDRQSLSGRR